MAKDDELLHRYKAAKRYDNNTLLIPEWMWDFIDVKIGDPFLIWTDKSKDGKYLAIFIPNADNIAGKAVIEAFEGPKK